MTEIHEHIEDPSKVKDTQEELERALHLIFRRTRALVAYAKGKCHERRDLVEYAEQIACEELGFLNCMGDMSTDPDIVLEEEILDAPYLKLVIELEKELAKLPNAAREGRLSIKQLIAKARELESAA